MANINTDLQVLFSICEGRVCSSFDIEDTTGIYNVNHLTSWGSPNPSISDADGASLDVQFPDGTIVTLDLLTLSSSLFPNTSGVTFTITSSMLGVSGKLPDGVYTFTYSVTGISIDGIEVPRWTSSKVITVLLFCQTDCCLKKLFSTITGDDCVSCSDKILDRVTEAYMLLISAELAAECGSVKRSNKLLNAAKFLCSLTSCANC